MTADLMRTVLARVNDLPTLPTVLERVARSAHDQRSSIRDVAGVIEADQALTTRVLRVANSAFYGMTRRVVRIEEGVALLGLDAVLSLVTTASVMEVLGNHQGTTFDRRLLWLHSVGVASGAKLLAARAGLPRPESAFVAGLLHDIGKLVLDRYAADRLADALRAHRVDGLDLLAAERQTYDCTHQDVGAAVADRWKLPHVLTDTIGNHHRPSAAAEHAPVAYAVQLADAICIGMGLGDSLNWSVSRIEPEGWEALQLEPEAVGALLPQIEGEAELLRVALGL